MGNENAQDFWGSLFDYNVFKGSNYLYSFWNDMNEPAVFSTDSHTMPMDAIHMKADGTERTHLEVHNAYGALHQRSSFRGLLKRDSNTQRPFVLTRSFFLGSQKYGWYRTGDNVSMFEEIQGSLSMILQLGNSGHPFGGSDTPGFYGCDDTVNIATDDLFVQFYQLGAWYPFFRAHSQEVDLPCPLSDREPWNKSSRVREVIRDAINRRYDLIHYIYTTAERATRTAEPLMRPMWSEFPAQSAMLDIANQFMFGDSMMVVPKTKTPEGVYKHMHLQNVTYTLPTGADWFDYTTKQPIADVSNGATFQSALLKDLDQQIFVVAGTVLPILHHEDCMSLIPCMRNDVRLEVYPTSNMTALGELYLDDGYSFNYTQGADAHAQLSVNIEKGANYTAFPNVSDIAIYDAEEPKSVKSGKTDLEYLWDYKRNAIYILMDDNADISTLTVDIKFK